MWILQQAVAEVSSAARSCWWWLLSFANLSFNAGSKCSGHLLLPCTLVCSGCWGVSWSPSCAPLMPPSWADILLISNLLHYFFTFAVYHNQPHHPARRSNTPCNITECFSLKDEYIFTSLSQYVLINSISLLLHRPSALQVYASAVRSPGCRCSDRAPSDRTKLCPQRARRGSRCSHTLALPKCPECPECPSVLSRLCGVGGGRITWAPINEWDENKAQVFPTAPGPWAARWQQVHAPDTRLSLAWVGGLLCIKQQRPLPPLRYVLVLVVWGDQRALGVMGAVTEAGWGLTHRVRAGLSLPSCRHHHLPCAKTHKNQRSARCLRKPVQLFKSKDIEKCCSESLGNTWCAKTPGRGCTRTGRPTGTGSPGVTARMRLDALCTAALGRVKLIKMTLFERLHHRRFLSDSKLKMHILNLPCCCW